MKKREFSLYDIEQFLREAGAERVNEKAVISLEQEIEDTVKELVDEASMYAGYAGRKRLIKSADIDLVQLGASPGTARPRIRRLHALRKRPVMAQNLNRTRMQRLSNLVEMKMLEK
jgi:histone H3/H4